MLPQAAKPEKGSRKMINGAEVWTKKVFTTDSGNIFETVEGEFILPNGELAKDKTILELLPGQHKERALEWWGKRFGEKAKIQEVQEKEPGRDDLLAMIDQLRTEVGVLTARLNASPSKTKIEPPELGQGKKGVNTGGGKKSGLKASVEAVADALEGTDQQADADV